MSISHGFHTQSTLNLPVDYNPHSLPPQKLRHKAHIFPLSRNKVTTQQILQHIATLTSSLSLSLASNVTDLPPSHNNTSNITISKHQNNKGMHHETQHSCQKIGITKGSNVYTPEQFAHAIFPTTITGPITGKDVTIADSHNQCINRIKDVLSDY